MSPNKKPPRPGTKRPYRPPKLTVHGDLKVLAKVTTKGGGSADGGKPATRVGGTPG